jgi:hypothetical protein
MPTRTEEILQRLEDKIDSLGKKSDMNIARLETNIAESIVNLRKDLKHEFMPKIQANTEDIAKNKDLIAGLQDKNEELTAELRDVRNELEVCAKANDLLVKGIPLVAREKCMDYYNKIAAAIGYGPNAAPRVDAFRLGKKRVGAKYDPPILLKFANKHDRTDFHRKYYAFKTLSLKDIGFGVVQRIIITENLSKSNQSIFTQAMALKKEQKLSGVSTSAGTVFVKPKEGDRPAPIRNVSELDRYART